MAFANGIGSPFCYWNWSFSLFRVDAIGNWICVSHRRKEKKKKTDYPIIQFACNVFASSGMNNEHVACFIVCWHNVEKAMRHTESKRETKSTTAQIHASNKREMRIANASRVRNTCLVAYGSVVDSCTLKALRKQCRSWVHIRHSM